MKNKQIHSTTKFRVMALRVTNHYTLKG